MNSKKILTYVGLLALGLLIGWFLFGTSSEKETMHQHDAEVSKPQLWTCSMHPQIMLPEAGDCPICGMDLILAEESSSELTLDQFRMSKTAMALANVETIKVSQENLANEAMQLTGTIEANEKTNAIQTAHFGGRIEKLYVNITGEEVRLGQRIALMYSPELVTTQQELITAMRMKASQPALYNAVRNKLKLWKLSEAQIQQLETSQKVMTQFPIYATVSGVVTEKMVEEGNHVMDGGALFKVANLNTVWASFDAYEKQLSSLKKGAEITITTNANPNKKILAKITFIDPVVNTATRTVSVKVTLNNKDGKLKPGMFVSGILENVIAEESSALTIPKSAVLWTGKRSIVYVKISADEPIFEAREVTLGESTSESYEVIDGLRPDDEIVTNGTFTVDAAAQLQGKKSMMNASKTIKTSQKTTVKMEFDVTFQKAFQPAIKAYLELKDALVQSDVALAAEKSDVFRKALEQLTLLQRETPNGYWSTMHQASKGIHTNASIENQRESFRNISTHMIEIVQNFDTLEQQLTVQFCPMVNNDKGAYWLSSETQIRNPYFGEMMLTCGEVKKVLHTDSDQ